MSRKATVVLAAGHGGSDPGACFGDYTERDEAVQIVKYIAEILKADGISVWVSDHSKDTHQTIPEINTTFGASASTWAIEIHRDSASGLEKDDASTRCGIYTGNSEISRSIGLAVSNAMKAAGAHKRSWSRSHTESRHKGGLGWINQVACMSHLIELGFMEGEHGDAHMRKLAAIGAAGIKAGLAEFKRIRGIA